MKFWRGRVLLSLLLVVAGVATSDGWARAGNGVMPVSAQGEFPASPPAADYDYDTRAVLPSNVAQPAASLSLRSAAEAEARQRATAHRVHLRPARDLSAPRTALSPGPMPSVDDITAINRGFGGSTTMTGHVDTVLANASYHDDIFGQGGSVIRDIAGRHLFDNGNKRTALAVVEDIFSRSGTASPGRSTISNVIDRVVARELTSVDEIAKALGG